jgi:hypothetical protein
MTEVTTDGSLWQWRDDESMDEVKCMTGILEE